MKPDYSFTLFAKTLIWLAGCFSPTYAIAESTSEAAIAAPAPEGQGWSAFVGDVPVTIK